MVSIDLTGDEVSNSIEWVRQASAGISLVRVMHANADKFTKDEAVEALGLLLDFIEQWMGSVETYGEMMKLISDVEGGS